MQPGSSHDLPSDLDSVVKSLLVSKSSAFRSQGVEILRLHVVHQSKKLSSTEFSLLLSRLFEHGRIHTLSTSSNNRLIGAGVLECVIKADDHHSVERRIGALNLLRDALEIERSSRYNTFCIQVVAAALGRLSRVVTLKPEF
mmetsp:Transcript_33795/g.104641  ORF Transcript_33795/g.104641 Transcript_33795/m.104641 type:complete len:142 (+) Transcript_33795:210-635(+)